MFVEERMSRPVISIHPEMPLQDALNLMHKEHIRRLPVVDKKGKLVGIVSERDLLHASPSDATSLNVWELNYLLSKITVDRIMTTEVITIAEGIESEEQRDTLAALGYEVGQGFLFDRARHPREVEERTFVGYEPTRDIDD